MKSILPKLCSHLCPQKGRQMVVGFIINLLLLFSFSLSSYFRPYYEHKNKDMNPYCVTFVKDFYHGEEDTEDYFQKNALSLFEDVKNTYYSVVKDVPSTNISVLFVREDFPLKELGTFHSNFRADEKSAFVINNLDFSLDAALNHLPFLSDLEVVEGHGGFLDGDIPFAPVTNRDCLIIVNEKYINQVSSDCFTTYCTIESKDYISDTLLSKIAKICINTGFIKPMFDSFIHPARDYMRYYGLIHPVTQTLLYLDILLGVTIFISFAFSKYLWLLRNSQELEFYLLFGMKERKLKRILTISGGIPYLLTGIVSYLAYLIFMWIFSAINGFTFFFNPYFYFVYFGLILLDFLIQYLFAILSMKKISKGKGIIEE